MKFNIQSTLSLGVLLGSLVAVPAMADHNSVWGAGTANMPNDIHNARIEGTTSDGTVIDDWTAFVSKGAGAETVNRYLDEAETLPSQTSMNGGATSPDQVARGGRPDSMDVPGVSFSRAGVDRPSTMTRTSIGIDRPAMVSRGGRR